MNCSAATFTPSATSAVPAARSSAARTRGRPSSVRALPLIQATAAFDPSGPAVPAPCARLYLVEDGKIKAEQVVFYVGQG